MLLSNGEFVQKNVLLRAIFSIDIVSNVQTARQKRRLLARKQNVQKNVKTIKISTLAADIEFDTAASWIKINVQKYEKKNETKKPNVSRWRQYLFSPPLRHLCS